MTHYETTEQNQAEMGGVTVRLNTKTLRRAWWEFRAAMSDPNIWEDLKCAMRGKQNPRLERQRRLANAVRKA